MTDLQILLIAARLRWSRSRGYLALVRPGAPMNLARAPGRRSRPPSCFVYLLWALLRPEDF